MSIRLGKVGQIPNWIKDNDWSSQKRLDWIHKIMAFSARDWSRYDGNDRKYPDAETWAIWCLSCCDSKEEALEAWYGLCKEFEGKLSNW